MLGPGPEMMIQCGSDTLAPTSAFPAASTPVLKSPDIAAADIIELHAATINTAMSRRFFVIQNPPPRPGSSALKRAYNQPHRVLYIEHRQIGMFFFNKPANESEERDSEGPRIFRKRTPALLRQQTFMRSMSPQSAVFNELDQN